ncbi:MAG: MBL fold metallo-hydrolase [candidate division WOR-3 bacterium]|nr:MBL fold metallo-hydrolase [candidate division WOR-3 bacterium]
MKNYESNAEIICLTNGQMDTNSYIISSLRTDRAIVIDPADGRRIHDYLESENLEPYYIINTHGHYDHISGNRYLVEKYGVPVCISPLDSDYLTDPGLNMSLFFSGEYTSPKADVYLEENKIIQLDDIMIKIISTPGHTPGSISLALNDIVFTGDLVFKNGIGRTDLPGGDIEALTDSLKNVFMKIKYENTIFPGHGESGKKIEFDSVLQQFFYTY